MTKWLIFISHDSQHQMLEIRVKILLGSSVDSLLDFSIWKAGVWLVQFSGCSHKGTMMCKALVPIPNHFLAIITQISSQGRIGFQHLNLEEHTYLVPRSILFQCSRLGNLYFFYFKKMFELIWCSISCLYLKFCPQTVFIIIH